MGHCHVMLRVAVVTFDYLVDGRDAMDLEGVPTREPHLDGWVIVAAAGGGHCVVIGSWIGRGAGVGVVW